jgi:chromosome partitioning protein
LRAYLIINQLELRTKLSRLMNQALAEMNLPVVKTAIRRRMVYRSAILEGRAVSNLGKRGAEARAEIEALIEEVL